MSILKIESLQKSYQLSKQLQQEVLKGIDLSFNRGEFVSIVGESGSGKSTLMNIIGGLDSDFQGEVLIDAESISDYSDSQLDDFRKKKIGFIFQSFNLIPHFSALENVAIAMTLSKRSKQERIAHSMELLKSVGLEEHADKKPNQLSGGEKQRVAIARALANDPDIILADEPTGSLDKETSAHILEILKGIADRGKLIIAVTHSSKVAQTGNRIVTIDNGIIVDDTGISARSTPSTDLEDIQCSPLSLIEAIRISAQNIRLNLLRNLLVAIGISIGITSVIFMLTLGSSVKDFMQQELATVADPLQVEVNKPFEKKQGSQKGQGGGPPPMRRFTSNPFTQADIAKIINIEHVADHELGFQILGNYFLSDGTAEGNIKPTFIAPILKSFTSNREIVQTLPEDDTRDIYEIVITNNIADTILSSTEREYSSLLGQTYHFYFIDAAGVRSPDFVVEIAGIYDQSSQDKRLQEINSLYISFADLKDIYSKSGKVLETATIYLYAEEANQVDSIKQAVTAIGFEGSRQEVKLEQVEFYLNLATFVLTGISATALLVSAIMILVVLFISVIERRREIGILRAIGARKKDIKRIFFSEAAIIGFTGGIFGAIGSLVLGIVGTTMARILFDDIDQEMILYSFELKFIIIGILIATVISIISGVIPAAKSAAIDPIESLRHE